MWRDRCSMRGTFGLTAVLLAGLAVTAKAFAYPSSYRVASDPDANNRANLWLKMESNMAQVRDADWGAQINRYRVKYTNLNNNCHLGHIDLEGGLFAKSHCTSSGGGIPGSFHSHRDTWRITISGAPTSGVIHDTIPGWSSQWHVLSIVSGYQAYGKAVGQIHNGNSGAPAGTVTVTLPYSGG
jgi:hypothetical protein